MRLIRRPNHYWGFFMGFLFRRAALVTLFVLASLSASWAGIETRSGQLAELNSDLLELENHYGMIKFKEEMFGTNYEEIRARYTDLIQSNEYTPDQFRQLMVALGAEFRDGHLNILRQSSDYWSFGMRVAEIDGRLYVVGLIPSLFVPATNPELKLKDEIVAVDGRPAQQVALELLPYQSLATYATRFADALESTVNRGHRRLTPVQTGAPVRLTFSRPPEKEGDQAQIFEGTFHWVNYKDLLKLGAHFPPTPAQAPTAPAERQPYVFGTSERRTYFSEGLQNQGLPFGVVARLDNALNAKINELRLRAKARQELSPPERALARLKPVERLAAYTVRHGGKTFGVVRIPDYSPGDFKGLMNELRWLDVVMQTMEASTDALIIDQNTNNGGYVYEVVQLVRLFANREMRGVTIDMRLTNSLLTALESWASAAPTSGDATEGAVPGGIAAALGDPLNAADEDVTADLDGTRNFARVHLSREYLDRLRERWLAGNAWSGTVPYMDTPEPYGTGDHGRIVGREGHVYTKPILVLNDSRSASGGDFFPSLMQANGRALIFGETSMGLGGPVFRQTQTPGAELFMRCTFGYCERPDGLPIENLGVVPDVPRWITPVDLRDDFKDYSKDVLQAALMLTEGKSAAEIRADIAKRRETAPPDKASFQALHALFTGFESVARGAGDAATLLTEYRAFFELLHGVNATDLTVDEWRLLTLPLPKVLTDADGILASLRRSGEVMERLGEMARLPRFADDAAVLALINELREGLAPLGAVAFGGCRDWLVPRGAATVAATAPK